RSAADKYRVGAQGDGFHYIAAAPDPAVDEHAQPAAHGLHDVRKSLDGSQRAVERASAMVRDDDAVGPDLQRVFGIFWMKDAFEHELTGPAVAYLFHSIPVEVVLLEQSASWGALGHFSPQPIGKIGLRGNAA